MDRQQASASEAVANIDERFLSVAVDTAQVVGGRFWSSSGDIELIGEEDVPVYDFGRPRLRALAVELAPAFLRIGGSDADRVIYDMSATPVAEAPEGFEVPQFIADFRAARALVNELDPGALFGGPSSAHWPTPGELFDVYEPFLMMGGAPTLDVITWHYYPQQSQRCPIRTDPYEQGLLLQPEAMDRGNLWAAEVEAGRDRFAPGVPIWLGESGHAQCGGQPGGSDRYEGTFWWLDELGAIARRDQKVLVRQTLSGSDYGLIDDVTLDPRPDYWASVLWRRLMGTRVLDVTRDDVADEVRLYAHCTRDRPGAVTLLAINVDQDDGVRLEVNGLGGDTEIYVLTADSIESSELNLNTRVLRDNDGALPTLAPFANGENPVDVPALGITFAVYPSANAEACR